LFEFGLPSPPWMAYTFGPKNMKTIFVGIITLISISFGQGIELVPPTHLEPLPHIVISDVRTYERDTNDHRDIVWTDDPTKVTAIAQEFGIDVKTFTLAPGKVFAVFLNDQFLEDLVQVTLMKKGPLEKTFADYLDSRMRIKMLPPKNGMKFSHLTAIAFTPSGTVDTLYFRRGAISSGVSEKK
jgi:hypothetical protein